VRNALASQLFPDIHPLDYDRSVRLALDKLDANRVETTWSGALSSSQGKAVPVALINSEGMIIERRQIAVDASSAAVYRSFASIGGTRGWLYLDWAWQLRGTIDRLLGGVGMRRGRRDPVALRVGDALDFWRVESVIPDRLIRLRAEMKVPGRAWLEYRVESSVAGRSVLSQTAFFDPKGLSGLLYWYALYPIHRLIFSGLIQRIAESSVTTFAEPTLPPVRGMPD
ncbi:MAG: DUF2867 domain-containing protein, partial [Chloroflexi bacterium]|nr:DUF2867 domain-containing protein [Chloroflexota bacterium]